MAVDENYRAHAGTERDDQFDTATGDGAEALHVSIIGYAHGAPERAAEPLPECEIVPALAEVGRGINDAVLGHSRKAHRDAIEPARGCGQLANNAAVPAC